MHCKFMLLCKYTMITCLLLLLFTKTACADITLSIERFNDTQGRLSGAGNIGAYDDLGGRVFFRFFDNPLVGTAPSEVTSHTLSNNSVTIGSESLAGVWSAGGVLPEHFYYKMSWQPADFSAFNGSVDIDLNVQTWAPIGTTGNVTWGNHSNVVGTWEIVESTPIPEPTTLTLATFVLLGMGYRLRRQK
jgi:hypothetical protein